MVSEVVQAPVETVDPVPEVETQTQGDPVEEVVLDDEPNTETTAAEDETAPEAAAPPELEREPVYTAAELRQEASRLAREQAEYEQRMRQSENARRAAREQREQADRQKLNRHVKLSLMEQGVEIEPEAITSLLQEFTDERQNQWYEGVKPDVEQAAEFLRARTAGEELPLLSDRQHQLAGILDAKQKASLEAAAGTWATYIGENYIPKADLDKHVQAALSVERAKAREGKEPLKRVDGSASTMDRSRDATIARIAAGTHDRADEDAWRSWEAQKGK